MPALKYSPVDIVGKKFNYWTTVKAFGRSGGKRQHYEFKCQCGKFKRLKLETVIVGRSKSCGCKKGDLISNRFRTHGMSRTDLYGVWCRIRGSCNSKTHSDFYLYGGRGIKVCSEWDSFEKFHDWALDAGYKSGLQIDREDNNGNYCPENCRFVTGIVNCNNKRNNIFFEYGKHGFLTYSEAGRIYKMNPGLIRARILSGKTPLEAVTQNKRGVKFQAH